MKRDTDLDRMEALCVSVSDQWWMNLERYIPEVIRISETGPREDDYTFIKNVFALFAYELTQRRDRREKETE